MYAGLHFHPGPATDVTEDGDISMLSVHDALIKGVPAADFFAMQRDLLGPWSDQDMADLIGVTVRTLQRWKTAPATRLSPDQSGRYWKFLELLNKAVEVFGDQAEAEAWFRAPTRYLGGRSPFELVHTAAGTEMVETYLSQMEYGVYV